MPTLHIFECISKPMKTKSYFPFLWVGFISQKRKVPSTRYEYYYWQFHLIDHLYTEYDMKLSPVV